MGKRSSFERVERDYYRTWDRRAVAALLPHLEPATIFGEPCAGDFTLARQLIEAGHVCAFASDIEPQAAEVFENNALETGVGAAECFITNPPWARGFLHDLIVHLSDQAPTWLLFDSDWVHTKQAIPFLPRLRKIVSIGRLRWIEGSKMDGKDNCSWHRFERPTAAPARFVGRVA